MSAHSSDSRASLRGVDRWATAGVLILSVLLLGVFGRVIQLQMAPSQQLRGFVGERTSRVSEAGWRGDLLDRRGRPIAVSRPAYRTFIDPSVLSSLDEGELVGVIDELAGVLPMEHEQVEARVRERIEASRRREREGLGPLRFAPIGKVLDDETARRVRNLKIEGVGLERREVRAYATNDASARVVGIVGAEHEGRLGAEYALDAQLREKDGTLRFVRDARGRPLWVEQGAWVAPEDGRDVRLSIDLELQRICEEELWRGIVDADAVAGRLVMIDPETGEVLAMCDLVREVEGLVPFPFEKVDDPPGPGLPERGPDGPRYITLAADPLRRIHPAMGRNRCVQDLYEPGSTFKPFVWAAVTQAGLASPGEVFDTYNGFYRTPYGRSIEDVTQRARMTWSEVLVNSSNIGMVQGAARMEEVALRRALTAFGFGSPTGIALPGEMAGILTPMERWSHWTQTSVAFGQEVAVTPVQMVRAFSAFARSGEQAGSLCELTLRAVDPDDPSLDVVRRVVDPPVALKVRDVLTHVASKMEAVMRRKDPNETGWRYRIFGKSGTADIPVGRPPEGYRLPTGSRGYFEEQYVSSFIAAGPYEHPRLVVIVVIDDPGPAHVFQPRLKRTHYGSHVAGPVVRRVLERSLAYLGVPPSDMERVIEIERVNEW